MNSGAPKIKQFLLCSSLWNIYTNLLCYKILLKKIKFSGFKPNKLDKILANFILWDPQLSFQFMACVQIKDFYSFWRLLILFYPWFFRRKIHFVVAINFNMILSFFVDQIFFYYVIVISLWYKPACFCI